MEYTDVLVGIRRIIRNVNLESKRIEKDYGISIPQLLCLNFLQKQPDQQASQKEIKDWLSLNASTVTGIINRLERKGLIAKLPRQGDKRVSKITITERGALLIADTPTPIHDRLSAKLKRLQPEHIVELQRAFELISNFLEGDIEDASPIITAEIDLRDKS